MIQRKGQKIIITEDENETKIRRMLDQSLLKSQQERSLARKELSKRTLSSGPLTEQDLQYIMDAAVEAILHQLEGTET